MVELKDAQGVVHAVIEKTLYIRGKDAGRAAVATEVGAIPVG
jgi:hypothetical protein